MKKNKLISFAISFFVVISSVKLLSQNTAIITKEDAVKYFMGKGGRWSERGVLAFKVGARISDDDFKYLSLLPKIKILHLSQTSISDTCLKHVSSLTQLDTLSLDDTKIGDEGLKYISNLKTIDLLDLKNTKVTDEGLKYLKNMAKLRELNLMGTKITDKGLDYLSEIPNLQMIMVRGTRITPGGVAKFKKKFPMTYITFETEEQIQ